MIKSPLTRAITTYRNHATFVASVCIDPDNPENMHIGQTFTQLSLTVPGLVSEFETLLARFSRGERVQVIPPAYLGEDTVIPDDFENMDFLDQQQFLEETKQGISVLQQRISARKVPAAPAPADPVPDPSNEV